MKNWFIFDDVKSFRMYKEVKTFIKNKLFYYKLKKENVLSFKASGASEKSVLIIDDNIPEFDKDSGSRRLLEIIKILLQNNVSVFLVGDIADYKYPSKKKYIEKYREIGVQVYEPSFDENGNIISKEDFIEQIALTINYAWLHRPTIFHQYHKMLKLLNKDICLIFDMVDFHYLRLIREWELNKKNTKRKKIAEDQLLVEIENCKASDKIIVISELDKEELKKHYPNDDKMVSIGNVHNFIEKETHFLPPSKRNKLLFVGGFNHKPNVDAVLFLKNEIMPLVWKEEPNLKVQIVGSYPPGKIRSLNSEKFHVVGYVEDISIYFKTARVFVAPLRYGAGIKGKIGQSFEYSLPVVTTDIGAEGFDFGKYADKMIVNDAKSIANKILKIYSDDKLWQSISDNSERIIKPFSKLENERKIKEILDL